MLKCIHCQSDILGFGKKFCSRSCSASVTNTFKVKHGNHVEKECLICKTLCKRTKYCSKKCGGIGRRKYKTDDERTSARRAGWKEHNAKYRAQLLSQTPSDIDRVAIREFYDQCPPGHEIDHIIPISKGGPHTLSNLQYLTIHDNRSKGAKIK